MSRFESSGTTPDVHKRWRDRVTTRETEVLELVRRHRTNAQIADALHLSSRTVESHVAALLRKSGASDRRDLARLAEAHDVHVNERVVGVRTYDTLLVGRDDLLADLFKALTSTSHRVLSLVGPGGVGKTRLLHEVLVAVGHEGGHVVVVDLLPVAGGRVAGAVAAALGISERTSSPARESLVAALADRPLLLGLDNAEHLLPEVADLVGLLTERCPGLRAVVTSRERLRLSGEHVVGVPALERAQDAVTLFCDRGRLDPAQVSESLLRPLDGLPLCLELAAARVSSMGLDGLETALAEPMTVLAGGRDVDERHRSAHAVVSWSYSLLNPVERQVLRDLGSVHHDVDLPTAAALTALPDARAALLLASLAEKSLLTPRRGPTARWALSQVVREFVREEARHGTDAELADRAARVSGWARARAAEWVQRPGALPDAGELADLVALATADPAAGGSAAPSPGEGNLARTVAALCTRAGRLHDAVDCLVVAATREGATPLAVEDLLEAASLSAARATAGDAASRLPVRAAELAASCGAEDLEVRALATAVVHRHRYPVTAAVDVTLPATRDLLERATTLSHHDVRTAAALAVAEAWQDRDTATAERALIAAERTKDPALIAGALDVVADAYAKACQYLAARRAALRRLSLLRALPADVPRVVEEIVDARHMAARTAMVVGDLDAAADIEASVSASYGDELADLPRLVRCRALQGRLQDAITQADRLWALWERTGSRPAVWMATAAAAAVLATGIHDEPNESQWRQRMLRLAGTDSAEGLPMLTAFLAYVDARLALHRVDLADAERLVARCSASYSDRWYEGFARGAGTELAIAAGLPADTLLAELRLHAQQSAWASAVHLRCLARLETDAELWAASLSVWERIGATFEHATTLRARGTGQDPPSGGGHYRPGDAPPLADGRFP